jgi:small subunit ribosomal protein S20
MPHTEHRKKTLRKAMKARERNRAVRSAVRTAVKTARAAVAGTPEGAAAASTASKRLDKAAGAGVIHPNKAARLKSRIAKAQNRAAAAKPRA